MVSVYCPTYNHKKYLSRCLDSIVAQKTSFPFEIIVRDDASTDGTSDIIKTYQAQYPDRIVPLILSENHFSQGLSLVAFEKAFRLMRGKYIAVCEGDDFWTDENKLQKQVDFMESHPDHSLCGHASFCADENGTFIKDKFFRPKQESCDLTMEEIIGSWSMPTCSLFYRKSCRTDIIIPFQGDCINGDYAQMVYFALKGKVYYLDEPLGAYRISSSGSISQRIRKDPAYLKKIRLQFAGMLDRINDYTDGQYAGLLLKMKQLTMFHLYLHLGEKDNLRNYREALKYVGWKTKIRYCICLYCHPVYMTIDNLYQKIKGASS